MNRIITNKVSAYRVITVFAIAIAISGACPAVAAFEGGSQLPTSQKSPDRRAIGQPEQITPADEAAIESQIGSVYQNFLSSYRLGAGDVMAIHVDQHQEDSVERVVVSPVGQVY